MKADIHLYIGDKEVEFSADPKILLNYKLTDLENPTVVRNSWSKSIEIPQTPANDDIFSHYWNLERMQYGAMFNAMIKVPFKLFANGDLIEKGYAKLDSIKMANHSGYYSVSLYGGLGSFLYNLQYDQSTDGGDAKKTLADLVYTTPTIGKDPDLGFTITKETVNSAWTHMLGVQNVDDKWNVINFAPVYNGLPSDFDADKVLINHRGAVGVQHASYQDGTNYYPIIGGATSQSGFSLGTLSEEMTSDEIFDFRSYLQRPVISVNRVLQACFQPQNNSGWEVLLDEHFFHDGNPYWKSGWMTLPLLRDLEINGGETDEITAATFTKINKNRFNLTYGTTLSSLNNVRMRVNVQFDPDNASTATTLYSAHHADIKGWGVLQPFQYVDHYDENDGVVVQLIGRDANGTICAASKAYLLATKREQAYYGEPLWNGFWKEGNGYPEPTDYVWIQGKWRKSGSTYYFADMNGNKKDIEFSFEGNSNIASIEIRTMMNGSEYIDYKFDGKFSDSTPDQSFISLWPTQTSTGSGHMTLGQVVADRVMGKVSFKVTEFYGVATDYEALFSGSYIPKEKLLSTKFSPADFLLSYAKLFGLYFYTDPTEVPSDEEKYPLGVIHIMDRDTFFTDEYEDLQDRIDRSKTLTITPTLAGSKWYEFKYNETDTDAAEAYASTYGRPYAVQRVNTGYNFDSNTTDLYKGTVFNNGVMVREKDKYFSYPTGGRPVWTYNGFTYELYKYNESSEIESVELEASRKALPSVAINTLGLPNYDLMSKLQCHGKENEAAEGDGVLLFYRGSVQTSTAGGMLNYWLTDDVQEMALLNGGNPCWLWTNSEIDGLGNSVAIKVNLLPHFTRDLTLFGLQEGNIVNSWNFGHPQAIFVPSVYTTEGDSLYDKCWASYVRDLYSVDGRKVTCFVRMIGKPGPHLLRKWYVWDNSIWRLNEVKDLNVADYGTVQCEFVKVQDVDNYRLSRISSTGNEQLIIDGDHRVAHSGGTVYGRVIMQSGGDWFTTNNSGRISGTDVFGNTYTINNAIRPNTGHGETTEISVVFPASSADTEISWLVHTFDGYGNPMDDYVIQEGDNTSILFFSANTYEISADGGTIDLDFYKKNVSGLTATSNKSWAVVNGVDPATNKVNVTVSTNTGSTSRTGATYGAVITLTGTGKNNETLTAQIRIDQRPGGISDLQLTTNHLEFGYLDTSGQTFGVVYGGTWTITQQDQ